MNYVENNLPARKRYELLMQDRVPYVDLCDYHFLVFGASRSQDHCFSMRVSPEDQWTHLETEV
jgi:hypothetical protein